MAARSLRRRTAVRLHPRINRAEVIISDYLTRLIPLTPLCAEEATAAGAKPQVAERFLLVDPLDGTREFLAGNGEFTINVALIERGAPIAGAVYAPAIGRLWVGGDTAFACEMRLGGESPDEGSRRRIQTRRAPPSLVAFASRSHLDPQSDAFLKGLPIGEDSVRGVVAEVLPDRRGPRRRLSAVRANDGVGHCGRRRGAACGRRRRPRSFRTSAFVR